ncbi:uncharacterized protein LOC113798502 [Dermatophagoides pteronyssinus]|uniref:uncharacterized protein LOC113798502 n=1 Tax=Dermatophagoides pteronyssinus TaxID=6956 RepID=UPI003F67AE0F
MLRNRLLVNINQCQRSKLSTSAEIPSEFIKTIKFRTCVNIYDELRSRLPRFYGKSPSEGVDITIDYVDTQSNQKPNKTIVALHGTADTFRTFTQLYQHFKHRSDVRIVMPNFPDFSHTRSTNYSFWHSSDEKYHLLQDLFRHLNIETIDCLVGHSYGNQSSTVLLQKPQHLQIKSLAIIAPQFLLGNFANDYLYRMTKFVLPFSKSEYLSSLLHRMKIHQSKSIPFKFNEIDELFHLLTIILDQQAIKDSPERIRLLNTMNISGFIMYSADERIIDKNAQQELYKLLNIENDQTIIVDHDDPKIIANTFSQMNNKSQQIMKKIIVKDGRHFPHLKYPNVTNVLIEKLINKC